MKRRESINVAEIVDKIEAQTKKEQTKLSGVTELIQKKEFDLMQIENENEDCRILPDIQKQNVLQQSIEVQLEL